MATLAKKTRLRRSSGRGKSSRVSVSRAGVVYRDTFEISSQDAAVLLSAIRQPQEISSSLKTLVEESARRCEL